MLLKDWVYAGQDYNLFWSLTLKEIELIISGAADKRESEMQILAWQIWSTANLIRADPKKFPKSPNELIKRKSEPGGQVKSWQQIKQIALMWNASLGGGEVKGR